MNKTTIHNRKAKYDYEVLESIEAGIVLQGCEVKSICQGKCDLSTSFAIITGYKVELFQFQIEQYENHAHIYNPNRTKKLLLHKKEIRKLNAKIQKGMTLIPLKLYFSNGKVKVLLGLCRGKKNYDKRRTLKEKQIKKEMRRISK